MKLEDSIHEYDMSVRTFNCLKRYGINTTDDLLKLTEDEMIKIRNLGSKQIEETKEIIMYWKNKLVTKS